MVILLFFSDNPFHGYLRCDSTTESQIYKAPILGRHFLTKYVFFVNSLLIGKTTSLNEDP